MVGVAQHLRHGPGPVDAPAALHQPAAGRRRRRARLLQHRLQGTRGQGAGRDVVGCRVGETDWEGGKGTCTIPATGRLVVCWVRETRREGWVGCERELGLGEKRGFESSPLLPKVTVRRDFGCLSSASWTTLAPLHPVSQDQSMCERFCAGAVYNLQIGVP